MNIVKNICAAAVAAFIGFSGSASAATVSCSDSGTGASLDCIGSVSGNNSNQDLTGYFDNTNGYGDIQWGSEIKVDNGTGGTTGIFSFSGNGLSGNWSVSSWAGIGAAMIVVKGGPNFSAYLIDLAAGTTGTWDTLGVAKGSGSAGPGLSHMSLYTAPGTLPPGELVVPLPAGLPLVLTGLGFFGYMRARKRKSA